MCDASWLHTQDCQKSAVNSNQNSICSPKIKVNYFQWVFNTSASLTVIISQYSQCMYTKNLSHRCQYKYITEQYQNLPHQHTNSTWLENVIHAHRTPDAKSGLLPTTNGKRWLRDRSVAGSKFSWNRSLISDQYCKFHMELAIHLIVGEEFWDVKNIPLKINQRCSYDNSRFGRLIYIIYWNLNASMKIYQLRDRNQNL